MTDPGLEEEPATLSFRDHAWRAAGAALLAFGFLMMDPFGFGGATNSYSDEVFGRILAPFYDDGAPDQKVKDERRAQDRIVIILYDDAYLEKYNMSWPVDPGIHTALLRKVAKHKPEAIFFDLLFRFDRAKPDKPDSEKCNKCAEVRTHALQIFADQIDRTQEIQEDGQHIKVLLAVTHKEPPTTLPAGAEYDRVMDMVPQLQNSSVEKVGVSWRNIGTDYPFSDKKNDPEGDTQADINNDRILDTPAARMFQIYCTGYAEAENPPKACTNIGQTDLKNHRKFKDNPLVIHWPSRANNRLLDLREDYGTTCRLYGTSRRGRWGEAIKQFFIALGSGIARKVEIDGLQHCTYHLTLAPDVFNDFALKNRLGKIIAGSHVLIGANITGAGDMVVSPTQGQLPGVNMHAIALDNLMIYGSNYYRRASKVMGIEADTIIEVISLWVVFLLASKLRASYAECCRRHQKSKANGRTPDKAAMGPLASISSPHEITALVLRLPNLVYSRVRFSRQQAASEPFRYRHPMIRAWVGCLGIASIPLVIAIALNYALRWPPANWVGIFFLSLFAIQFVFGDTASLVMRLWQQLTGRMRGGGI
jgi:hypothetical protein